MGLPENIRDHPVLNRTPASSRPDGRMGVRYRSEEAVVRGSSPRPGPGPGGV